MPNYEYGRIRVLARELAEAGIAQEIVDQVMEGGDAIRKSTSPAAKTAWMAEAMRRMDTLLDAETRHAVREACACCLRGKRQELSRGIGKRGGSLEERVAAANETPYVFGDGVELQEDGRILVRFAPEGQESYRCVCLHQPEEPISITYCYCCGGHIKHHLQNALGRKLRCEARSTALSTAGKAPCSFLYTVAE